MATGAPNIFSVPGSMFSLEKGISLSKLEFHKETSTPGFPDLKAEMNYFRTLPQEKTLEFLSIDVPETSFSGEVLFRKRAPGDNYF